MIELRVIEITPQKPKGHGLLKLQHLPRIGEWIAIDVEEMGTAFEVVAVVHPTRDAPPDAYVKRREPLHVEVSRLCKELASEERPSR